MIVTTDDKHYGDIADAIRDKLGTTDRYKPSEMAAAIQSISSGGGGTIPSASPKDVNFYDYDGKLLYSYTLAEVQSLAELPAAPDHSSDTIPLTFQGWNYTLAEVNALTDKCNIGATYIPTDGKTHLTIHIAEPGRMTVPLYFNQTVSNGVTIDWGDGSPPETLTGTWYINTTHTYSDVGTYDITLDVTSGVLGLGADSFSHCVMGSTYDNGLVYCNMLKSVRIGNSVTTIGEFAFYNCYSLASVTIPNSVETIGNSAFNSCRALTSVTIPNSVIEIFDYAFYDCSALASVTIPNSVYMIGISAFDHCYSLASVTIPNNVYTIDVSTFADCRALASVTIPNNVVLIYDSAFRNCYSLTSVTIPNSVMEIGNFAFYSCYSLTSVTIPNSVMAIYSSAFDSCSGMAHYYVYCTTPPALAGTNVFIGIPSDCVIHVPAASLSAYQSATNWAAHADKMVGDL